MKKNCIVVLMLISGFLGAKDLLPWIYTNTIRVGLGRFYGSQSTPLPADAFQQCVDITGEAVRPHILVWSKSSTTLNGFVDTLNSAYTAYASWGVEKNVLQTLFYGTSRQAEKDAYAFVLEHYGDPGNKAVCICYGKFEDGYVMKTAKTFSSVGEYQNMVNSFVAQFNRDAPKHKYIPPKSSVKLTDEPLEAIESTKRVYVDLVRTNHLDLVKTNWVVTTYPGGFVSTNEIAWTAEEEKKELEISMSTNGVSVFTEGERVMLELLNTNRVSIATNYINFVSTPENSVEYPAVNGASFGEWTLDFAAATSKVFAANSYLQPDTNHLEIVTNTVQFSYTVSNRYDTIYTNDVAAFEASTEIVPTNWTFTCTASNRETYIYTNDLTAFGEPIGVEMMTNFVIKVTNTTISNYVNDATGVYTQKEDKVEFELEFPKVVNWVVNGSVTNQFGDAEVSSTNGVCNSVTYIFVPTNETYNAGSTVTNTSVENVTIELYGTNYYYTVAPATATNITETFEWVITPGTNQVYVVVPGEDESTTNLLSYEAASLTESIAVTNWVQILPEGEEHPNGTVEVRYLEDEVKTVTFNLPDTVTYVTASRDLEPQTEEIKFSETLTNRLYYVFEDTGVTNECIEARQEFDVDFTLTVTNFTHLTWTNEVQPVVSMTTEFEPFTVGGLYSEYAEAFDSVTTNTYQHGAEKFSGTSDGGRAEYAGLKAFTLAVAAKNGDATFDVFARDVIASTNFTDWCALNQIVPVMLSPESLGSAWKSCNGFSKGDVAGLSSASAAITNDYALESGEIVLIRPDGNVGGRLAMQIKDGKCDVDENIARLNELLAMANNDAAECANDAAENAMPIEFGTESPTNTLHISDKVDMFKVLGVPTNTEVSVKISSANVNDIGFAVLDEEGNEINPRLGDRWVFDTTNVYIAVTAYTNEASVSTNYGGNSSIAYAVEIYPAPRKPGKIGFSVKSDEVIEDGTNNTVYALKVARTGGMSGAVSVKVCLDTNNTTSPDSRYEWNEDIELKWDNLEFGEKTVELTLKGDEHCWGERTKIAFHLENGTNVVDGFQLLYVDDDQPRLGWLTIEGTEPEASTDNKVYVRGGTDLLVKVGRVEGSNYGIAGIVQSTFGQFETNTLEWADADDETKTAKLTVPRLDSGSSRPFTVTLSGEEGVQVYGVKKINCIALAEDAPEFAVPGVWKGTQYTSFSNAVQLSMLPEGWTVVSARKLTGSLPSGITHSLDKANGRIVFKGVPPVGSKEVASLWQMTLRDASSRTIVSFPVEVKIAIDELGGTEGAPGRNPSFQSNRSWTSLPVTNAAGRLVGLLNLQISKNGRSSARYTTADGVFVSFSTKGLDSFSDETGLATICATRKYRNVEYSLYAEILTNGAVNASIGTNTVEMAYTAVEEGFESWSAANSAADWSGNYTAVLAPTAWDDRTLCFGTPSLSLKFTSASQHRTGQVKFVCALPNGRSASGSATFVRSSDGSAALSLPVFATSQTDTFGAILSVLKDDGQCISAKEGTVPYWTHTEKNFDEVSYDNEYTAAGVRYAAGGWDALLGFCFVDTAGAETNLVGEVKASGKRITVVRTQGAPMLSFSLAATGVASGKFKTARSESDARLTQVNWRGCVVPGLPQEMMGSWWRDVTTNIVNSATGNTTKRTVRVGGEVYLEAGNQQN